MRASKRRICLKKNLMGVFFVYPVMRCLMALCFWCAHNRRLSIVTAIKGWTSSVLCR